MSDTNLAPINAITEKVVTISKARKCDFYILCVDDEADILEIMKESIEATGFKCYASSSPKEALRWLEKNAWRTALILSDFNMPEMNGFAFSKEIPESAAIPFIILSGFIDKELALKGVENKVAAFLTKPAKPEEIYKTIEKEALPKLATLADEIELLQGFIEDAKGLLEQIEPLILGFEETPGDREALNSLYGMVHTIKGASGFFEPKTMHNFVHKFEDRLKQIQASNAPVSEAAIGMMLKATDIVRSLLAELESHNHNTKDITPLLECLEIQQAQATQTEEAEAGAAKEKTTKTNELKIDVNLLDQFVQASGEMTVIRNMITKSVQAIEKSYKSDRDVHMLSELLEEFHKINASVQSQISDLRKVPVRTVLKSLPRIVRDLSKSLGKKVSFNVLGDELRVDTAVIEALNKSIVHLVRNSLDHGLEPPDQRGSKNPTGNIEIRASIKDENICVEVSDDGRGINTKKIKEKAINLKLFTAEALESMSEESIHLLIFESGFSTAEQVTDVSGRGVGMSVVKESVEALGGRIEIDSNPGKGTTFRLRIPVPKSVLIKNCLFIATGGQEFGIPHDQIVRVVHSPKIETLQERKVFRLNRQLIPIVPLDRLFSFADAEMSATYVIVKTASGGSYAIPIDEVHDFEDTVIKPIEGFVRRGGVFSGATFLGDGAVGLVLDIEGVAKAAGFQLDAVAETTKNTDSSEKPVDQGTEFLLFELDREQAFAIPAAILNRIEEMRFDQSIQRGKWRKVPYRNGILNVIHLQSALGWGNALEGEGKQCAPVLVVESEEKKFGLEIGAVREFFRHPGEIFPPPKVEFGVIGNLVYQNKTITVLDPLALFNPKQQSSEITNHESDAA